MTSGELAERYLKAAQVTLLALDAEGMISALNPNGARSLGYEEGEIDGKDWFLTCVPESRRESERERFAAFLKGKDASYALHETMIVRKDGVERTFLWHNALLPDEKGKTIGMISEGEDVTDRRYEENRLALLGQLSSPLLRHIKEPLLRIQTSAFHLKDVVTRSKKVEAMKDLEQIYLTSKQIERVLGVLYEFTHPTAVVRETIEPQALLSSIENELRAVTDATKVALTISTIGKPHTAEGSKQHWQFVLYQVLSRALRLTADCKGKDVSAVLEFSAEDLAFGVAYDSCEGMDVRPEAGLTGKDADKETADLEFFLMEKIIFEMCGSVTYDTAGDHATVKVVLPYKIAVCAI